MTVWQQKWEQREEEQEREGGGIGDRGENETDSTKKKRQPELPRNRIVTTGRRFSA